MGLNFYDYDGLQPKVTPPKHFSRQCIHTFIFSPDHKLVVSFSRFGEIRASPGDEGLMEDFTGTEFFKTIFFPFPWVF